MPRRTRALPEPMRDKNGIRIYCVDVMDGLRGLPDESVHCAVTSPPYWGLRDYGVDGQVGLEKTPEEYVKRMVGIFREVRRVLRGDGTFWLNIGDCYAASQSTGGGYSAKSTLHGASNPYTKGRQMAESGKRVRISSGLKHKDLVGIPWRLAFALQADGWYLRSDIIWAKPNSMPESVTDRPTKSHEYVFLLTKKDRYFFDNEAVREAQGKWDVARNPTYASGSRDNMYPVKRMNPQSGLEEVVRNPAGRNIRTVWTIPTQPNPEAHFATFPERLPMRCIKAGTSERGVCPECGAPWERVVEVTGETPREKQRARGKSAYSAAQPEGNSQGLDYAGGHGSGIRPRRILGWRPTCECLGSPAQVAWDGQMGLDEYEPVPATVLDPFIGSGTTLFVAKMLGRHAIGFDLSEKYCSIAVSRCMKRSRRGISRHKRLRKSRR